MARRSVFDLDTPQLSPEQVNTIIGQFAQAEGFRSVAYRSETVFKRGYGILVSPQYVKIQVMPGQVRIEAWIRALGEKSLDGFVAAIPKNILQGKVNRLIQSLAPDPSCVRAYIV